MPTEIYSRLSQLEDGSTLRYSIAVPAQKGIGRDFPLILGLHPGWGGELPPPDYGGDFLSCLFLPAFEQSGAIIVAPDCPAPAWKHPCSEMAILALLDELQADFNITAKKTTLVGYSAGGWGAWYLLVKNPGLFSTAILLATLPVLESAASVEQNLLLAYHTLSQRKNEWLELVPDLPLFIIHSQKDELLPFEMAVDVYKSLQAAGKQIEFCPLEGIGHFESAGYIEPLRSSIPWLERVWSTA